MQSSQYSIAKATVSNYQKGAPEGQIEKLLIGVKNVL
jgi:hypothetical protein